MPKEITATMIDCPICGCDSAIRRNVKETIPFTDGKDEISLIALVPTILCHECKSKVVDKDGERARDEVVYRHLRRLPPWEIKGIRKQYKLSQAKFSKAFGISRASLDRWERGVLVQNESLDNLFRLLKEKTIGARLTKERVMEEKLITNVYQNDNIIRFDRFRLLKDINRTKQSLADTFKLRMEI